MKPWIIVKYTGAFLLGALVCFIIMYWEYFTFDTNIVVLDLVNLLLTAALGYYIATSLTKKQGSERVEKDLLIEELKKIKSDIENIMSNFQSNNLKFSDTVANFKSISTNLSSVEELISSCEISQDCGIRKLRHSTTLLKKIVTNQKVVNDKITMEDVDIPQALNLYNDIRKQIYSSIVSVNRYDS